MSRSGTRYDGSRYWCRHERAWRRGDARRTRGGFLRVFCPVCGYMMRTRPRKRKPIPRMGVLPPTEFALEVGRALLEAKGREATPAAINNAAVTVRRLGAQLLIALAQRGGVQNV